MRKKIREDGLSLKATLSVMSLQCSFPHKTLKVEETSGLPMVACPLPLTTSHLSKCVSIGVYRILSPHGKDLQPSMFTSAHLGHEMTGTLISRTISIRAQSLS